MLTTSDTLDLKRLIPTQNSVRDFQRVIKMTKEHLAGPIVMTAGQIVIKNIDDKLYIHDGHHRCLAKHIAGCEFLYPNEFVIKSGFTNELFNSINFDVDWVTPFLLESEVRKANLYEWKVEVNKRLKTDSEEEVSEWILSNRWRYSSARLVDNLSDMCRLELKRLIRNNL